MATVNLKNLRKKFSNNEEDVIQGINLEIDDSEFMVLVGPSGCGKSTTLRIIAGLEDVSQGEVYIDDILVNNKSPKDRNVAMVFQNYALYPHMNVFNNMAFSLQLRRQSKGQIKKQVYCAAEILNIVNKLECKPSELSGGERQRVAMGRAIVRNPSLFLFDEPLSNLDAKLRTEMRLQIKLLHQRLKTTILYVTHDQVEAMTLGDRIVVLKDGIIEQVGNPEELFHKPQNKFVAEFIGSPKMNLKKTRIEENSTGLTLKFHQGLKFPVPACYNARVKLGQTVYWGLRAHDITPLEQNQSLPAEWCKKGIVEVVEPHGAETYLHLNLQGATMVGHCDGRKKIASGDTLDFSFNQNHLHLFDEKSEKAV